jgi:hydrogenase-4 component B
MVKLGLYGFLRIFVEFLAAGAPQAAAAWGWGIGGFGLLSAVVGGAAACVATDAKVLLAYSSVAQSGIVALGVGASLVLAPAHPELAALALLGAAFHVVGDAVVKALLFLNAGALQWRTGSRDFADLGGLMEAMPVTGWTALVGSLAIAGFPPLTAFTGKWLLLQATVLSREPLVSVAGLGLLMASLLSVLYAVKFFAAGFANRSRGVERGDVPGGMRAAQVLLAGLAVVLGLLPGLAIAGIIRLLGGIPVVAQGAASAWQGALGPMSGAFLPLALVALGVVAAGFARACLGPGAPPAARGVWMGGVPADRGAPRIHPLGFYSPLREALGRVYPRIHPPPAPRAAWLAPAVDPDRWLYGPAARAGRRAVASLRRLHTGVPHVYIAWQIAGAVCLAVLLVFLVRR